MAAPSKKIQVVVDENVYRVLAKMSDAEKIERIRRAIGMAMGDDLERANLAFRGLSGAQLEQQWGASGKTRCQIWQEYKDERAKWQEVLEWFDRLVAATPDLLAACKRALKTIEDLPLRINEDRYEPLTALSSAIAKAEGKSD